MPASDVEVKLTSDVPHKIKMDYGEAPVGKRICNTPNGVIYEGELVNLSVRHPAEIPEGEIFSKWVVKIGHAVLSDQYNEKIVRLLCQMKM